METDAGNPLRHLSQAKCEWCPAAGVRTRGSNSCSVRRNAMNQAVSTDKRRGYASLGSQLAAAVLSAGQAPGREGRRFHLTQVTWDVFPIERDNGAVLQEKRWIRCGGGREQKCTTEREEEVIIITK